MLKKRWMVGLVLILIILAIVYVVLPGNQKEVKLTEVYVTKDSIAAGEPVDAKWFETVAVENVADWMITNLDEIKGKRAARIIPPSRFLDVNDFTDEMPIVYQNGEGEYTIRTRPEYVNGGRLSSGDVVNVIYVENPNATNQQIGFSSSTGISDILDVTVLSVRTQYAKDVDEENKKNDLTNVPAFVTLKVQDEEAKKLAWYQEHGTLSLFVTKKGERMN